MIVRPAALSSSLTTPSMVYSVPMVLFGLWPIWNARRRRPVPRARGVVLSAGVTQRCASRPTTWLSILLSSGFCSSPKDLRAAMRTVFEV